VVERLGLKQIANVKMHVTDRRAGRHAGPLLFSCGTNHAPQVERDCRHRDLPPMQRPLSAGSIGVYLDAQPVWIGGVNRFADRMVRRARVGAGVAKVLYEASERGAVRDKNREVVQPKQTVARNWVCTGLFMELDERKCHVVERSEKRGRSASRKRSEAEETGVVPQRSIEIGHLQSDTTDMSALRETISGWSDARC